MSALPDALALAWLIRLGSVAAQGLLLVALVAGLCRLWPRMPVQLRGLLWWMVCLQPLLGLVAPAAGMGVDLPWQDSLVTLPALQPGDESGPGALPARIADAAPAWLAAEPAWWVSPAGPWPHTVLLLWLVGAIWSLVRWAAQTRAALTQLQQARPVRDTALLARHEQLAGLCGLRRAPALMVLDGLASPQLVGIWQPRVLLPAGAETRYSRNELDMCLCHELIHLRRGDLWAGVLATLAQPLLWFSPAPRIAARAYDEAREQAVDAEVLRRLSQPAADYGELLLRLSVGPARMPGLATASPSFRQLQRRLSMLQHTSRALGWHSVPGAALALVVVAAGCAPYAATSRNDDEGEAYVLRSGDQLVTSATELTIGDDGEIDSLRDATGPVPEAIWREDSATPTLWVRRDGVAWMIDDPHILARANALFTPAESLGDQQSTLGEQQAELGLRQAELGVQQAQLGQQQMEASLKLQRMVREQAAESEIDRVAARIEALGTQQEALGEQQEALGLAQEALGSQQEALSEQQDALSEQAQDALSQLIDEAMAQGKARLAQDV